jgi:very-short-patch-repair endonuclease
MIFRGSDTKCKFICERGHKFDSRLANITAYDQWCPDCKYKTELKLNIWLTQYFRVDTQTKFDWCVGVETKRKLPFDFFIPDMMLLIELDGEQHFRQVSNWKDPKSNCENDIYKMDRANENGYTVIRIVQEDVLYDRYDWGSKLIDHIYRYESPTRVFICQNNEYENHKK